MHLHSRVVSHLTMNIGTLRPRVCASVDPSKTSMLFHDLFHLLIMITTICKLSLSLDCEIEQKIENENKFGHN